jgi:hypothetical protein
MVDVWELILEAAEGAEPLGTVRLGDVGRSIWKTTHRSRVSPFVRGLEPLRG